MKNNRIKVALRFFVALTSAIILPIVGLVVGAENSFGIEIGLVAGSVVGFAIYLFVMMKYLQMTKGVLLTALTVLAISLAYSLLLGGFDWYMSIMFACFSVVLTTAPQAIQAMSAAGKATDSADGVTDTNEAAVYPPPISHKRKIINNIIGLSALGIAVIAAIILQLNPTPATTPEDVVSLYQQTNPTYSIDGITFPIQPDWVPIEGMEGAYTNKEGTAIFALNGISQLGSSTPEEVIQEIRDMFSESHKVTSYPVIASYTTSDGIQCRTGDIVMEKDSSTYAFIKVVVASQKNMVISFIGQRSINDTETDVVSPTREMMFGLTFQVADQDMVSGNTFVSQGDGSQLCLKEDGSFYYYAMADDHSQKYYIGTYESYYGQAAFDKIVSMTEYGLTAEELERTHAANMNGYIPGGSSPDDYLYALDPTKEDTRPRYQICTDSFYALILHNDKIVMSKDDVQDSGNSTLYIGYYVPELNLLDLLNANAASQYGFEFVGRTTELDVEPTE